MSALYLPSIRRNRRSGMLRMGGVSMIEVLITIVVLSVGLVGLAKLQAYLQVTEMESYQRSQALLLVKDMANRIAINRKLASSYVVSPANPLGAGMTCATTTSSSTLAQVDFAEWCTALQGAAEQIGINNKGSVLGGRGCVEQLTNPNEYLVTVAWQGLVPLVAPATSVTCGASQYRTSDGGVCDASELCRRTVTTVVRIDPLG